MQTRNKELPLHKFSYRIPRLHQKELHLPEESNYSFRVVNATINKFRIGHFLYEIYNNEGQYCGEYCEGGNTPRNLQQALEEISRTYKERLKPPVPL